MSLNYTDKNGLSRLMSKLKGLILNSSDLDKRYPIGSLYWSSESTDPSTLFGGTWERIKDKFILAAGDNYEAGSTGGEVSHKLTTSEIPSHNHVFTGTTHLHTYSEANTATESHSLTIAEMPSHNHSVKYVTRILTDTNHNLGTPINANRTDNDGSWTTTSTGSGDGHSHDIKLSTASTSSSTTSGTISSVGGGQEHNNMPPYKAYYCWERIA